MAAPDPPRDRGRLVWVDVARGLGIVLVLLGHSPALRGAPKTAQVPWLIGEARDRAART